MKCSSRIAFIFLWICLGIVSISAQEKVQPRNGDGITTLLMRYNRPGTKYRKQFIDLNKSRLGKNNSLILGRFYLLPPFEEKVSVSRKKKKTTQSSVIEEESPIRKAYEPLFGKELAEYEVTSSELKGAVFYVSSGHGGPDPGAIGQMDGYNLHEHEYAYDITLRLARNLMMKGAKVYIIIQDAFDGIRDDRILGRSKLETCMGEAIPLGQVARLKQRSDKINELYQEDGKGYARAIFIHVDSRSKSKQTDVFFYHSSQADSKKLAQTMKNTFARKYDHHQPGRGFTGTVGERSLYMLNNTVPVSVFVELGNIQNPFDQRRFVIANNRQALANWMCEAFIADYAQHGKRRM